MSIFSGINVVLEAKEFKIMAYQSDMDAFNAIKAELNASLKEGEIKEEDIFSKMIQFAISTKPATEPKKGKPATKPTVKSKDLDENEIQ